MHGGNTSSCRVPALWPLRGAFQGRFDDCDLPASPRMHHWPAPPQLRATPHGILPPRSRHPPRIRRCGRDAWHVCRRWSRGVERRALGEAKRGRARSGVATLALGWPVNGNPDRQGLGLPPHRQTRHWLVMTLADKALASHRTDRRDPCKASPCLMQGSSLHPCKASPCQCHHLLLSCSQNALAQQKHVYHIILTRLHNI